MYTSTAAATPSYGGSSSNYMGQAAGAAGIEAGSTFLAQLGDYNFGKASADYNYDLNKKMADYTWKKNLEMWNMANEYNSPASQMQRFKDAGLNPNLIYGQGTPGNAGSIPKYEGPTRQPVQLSRPSQGIKAMDALNTYYGLQMQKKQMDAMDAQIQLTKKRALTEDANMQLRELMGIYQEGKNRMQSVMEGYYPDTMKIGLAKSQAELGQALEKIGLLKADNILRTQQSENAKLDYQLKAGEVQLMKAGLQRSSNPLLQLLSKPIGETGEMIDKGYDWLKNQTYRIYQDWKKR